MAEPVNSCHGPGYASPAAAMNSGDVEKLLYITCVSCKGNASTNIGVTKGDEGGGGGGGCDFLAVVDVDPESESYCEIVSRVKMPTVGDEIHHFGWNACSSCHGDPSACRDKLVICGVNSGNIHIVSTSDERNPTMYKTVWGKEIAETLKVSAPHTAHCLANGKVMISMMGDDEGNANGSFVLLDSQTFALDGLWSERSKKPYQLPFGYDFWYQPRQNIMVSTEWAAPKIFRGGFFPDHVKKGLYGSSVNFFEWDSGKFIKTIHLGEEGRVPLEVRFLHQPEESDGFFICALSSNVFRIFLDESKCWRVEKVIDMSSVRVDGWTLPEMPAFPTSCLISLDDKYLYFSNWLQGDIRQYDISGSNRSRPLLVGRAWIGGSLTKEQIEINRISIHDHFVPQPQLKIKGRAVEGGPQMLQLSLDGKRLYVTTSLFSSWDKQFYPKLTTDGTVCLKLNVDIENGGITLDDNFLVDFGGAVDGPALAHEIRYPGGDCTSDIWL